MYKHSCINEIFRAPKGNKYASSKSAAQSA